MINGFALPNTEFETPWRVINYHACVGGWNDPALRFDRRRAGETDDPAHPGIF